MTFQEQQQFFSFLEYQYSKFTKLNSESEKQILHGVSFTGYENLNVKITTITDNVTFTLQQKWFNNDNQIPAINISLPFKDCEQFLANIYNDYFDKQYVYTKDCKNPEKVQEVMQYIKNYLKHYQNEDVKIDYDSFINIPYKNKNIRLDIGQLYDGNMPTNVSLTGIFTIPFLLEQDQGNDQETDNNYLKLPFCGWESQNYNIFNGFVNIQRSSNLTDMLKIFKKHFPENANILNYHILDNSIINKDKPSPKHKI